MTSIARRLLPWLLLLPVVALVDVGVAAEGVARAAGSRAWRRAADAETIPRLVVLGFDGVDPDLVREFLDDLPAIRTLVARGGLHDLESEIPPESPVAWASLQTGRRPSWHAIFDFIGRESSSYAPTNAMVDFAAPPFLFGSIPTRPPRVESLLAYPTFSERVARAGYPVLGLRPPLTFPARPIPSLELLTGLGTPDLAGTNGAYAYYDSGFTLAPEYTTFNGHRVHLEGGPGTTAFQTALEGPYDRRRKGPRGGFERITVPLRFERVLPDGPVTIVLDGERVAVAAGETTPLMRVAFRTRTLPAITLRGRVSFDVQSIEPLRVLASPVQIDPNDPALPISTPPEFARQLEAESGPYSTPGWLEPTFPLNDGLMAPETFAKHVFELMDRDHALLLGELTRPARRSSVPARLVFHVFTETDRMQHCFWWLRDPESPYYDKQKAARFEGRDPIREIYRRMDRVIADTVVRLGPRDTLLVVSDHGFQSFRYGFNVNQWLLNEGYLVMKEGRDAVDEGNLHDLFSESLTSDAVDWSRTRAYAIGLGQIYINRKGREPQGVVADDEVAPLVAEIRGKIIEFVDTKHGNAKPVVKAYDLRAEYGDGPAMARAAEIQLGFSAGYRVSWQTALMRDIRWKGTSPIDENGNAWSGDHCSTDRDLVHGFLLSSRALATAPQRRPYSVRDIAATVLEHFHIDHQDLDGDATPLPLGSD